MANGNNSNADDAGAAEQQQQQSECLPNISGGDGGVCDDGKRNETATLARGNINDLVADLLFNGSREGGYGDYNSTRATTATGSVATAAAQALPAPTSTAASGGGGGSSSFSFKHFLNSSGTVTAPSTTVTSLDAVAATTTASSSSTNPMQTSTGARPKVPQSASASLMQPDINGSSASSKMKRSPRFSSFDSQASLAEYAACGGSNSSSSCNRLRADFRLEHNHVDDVVLDDDDDDRVGLAQVRSNRLYDDRGHDDIFPTAEPNLHERRHDDIFPSADSNLHASTSASRYVPRSYSSYDMPPQATVAASPRRGNRGMRPNRLVLNAPDKMKLDLPLDSAANRALPSGGAGLSTDYPLPTASSAALPDFVQDHLPDSWCGGGGHDAHLSSPPNSPLGGNDEAAAGAIGGCGGLLPNAAAAAAAAAGLPCAPSLSTVECAAGGVKMLPDFLSDGPIIHSSQRLADVAIGLPSNSIDSPPQDAAGTLQLSTMRQENERLQRELQETRVELSAQTRRALDLEQQLLLLTEESRRRESLAATSNALTTQRLQRQVAQLMVELGDLRRSRDGSSDGAVGGNCERVAASVLTPGSSGNVNSCPTRPSRPQQLSRDLLRAADNAEQNLRQLLVGVENLRQMAANLDPQQSQATGTPRSPDLYPDFN
ncbi:uncharacterized protein LOC115632429 [Scaptodrosophila lebanonensis]|uniref:Uncharacterized protein LOC115632429 n=1 Tax=Drosophila lebanonensis TaxID=7225 RepID=A0A6J2UBK5_DROLE|nr:uncharacterized protein LOC115632429 [Scaptodrosophila lebanonensis]